MGPLSTDSEMMRMFRSLTRAVVPTGCVVVAGLLGCSSNSHNGMIGVDTWPGEPEPGSACTLTQFCQVGDAAVAVTGSFPADAGGTCNIPPECAVGSAMNLLCADATPAAALQCTQVGISAAGEGEFCCPCQQ